MIPAAEDLQGAVHLRRIMHADGPRGRNGFYINIDECVEFPRLSRQRTIMRATGEVSDLWMVDQHPAGQLEDAVAIINGDSSHVPIAIQVAAIENLAARKPEALAALADPATDTHELEAVLRTLRWCQENAAELRSFRKHRQSGV